MPLIHVAIVSRQVAKALLAGVKRVETRFYRRRRVPLGRISAGDVVHFKLSGGELVCSSQVIAVQELNDLNPRRMCELRRRMCRRVAATESYWRERRGARYGALIWLGQPTAPPRGLRVPRQYGNGWVVLGGRRWGGCEKGGWQTAYRWYNA